MSRQALEQLVNRWTEDQAFREELRRDPERAILRTGLQFADAECAVLRDTDWRLPDDELKTRMANVADIQPMVG